VMKLEISIGRRSCCSRLVQAIMATVPVSLAKPECQSSPKIFQP